MKKGDTLTSYQQVADGLDELATALNLLIELYQEVHCTFAEQVGECNLSQAFDPGGPLHVLAEDFQGQCRKFEDLQALLQATKSVYEVWRRAGPLSLN